MASTYQCCPSAQSRSRRSSVQSPRPEMTLELPQGCLLPCTPPGRGWTRGGGPSGSWPPRSHRDHHTRRRTRDPDQRPGRRRLCSDLGWFSCNLSSNISKYCQHTHLTSHITSPFMLDTPTLSLELAQLCECFRLKESCWPPPSLFLVLKLFNSFCHRDSRPSWTTKY